MSHFDSMPHCAYCGKRADQIDEYIYAANGSQLTVLQYVIEEEGTLNPRTNHFACTDCYIKIGMPANRYPEPNWTVPDDVGTEPTFEFYEWVDGEQN